MVSVFLKCCLSISTIKINDSDTKEIYEVVIILRNVTTVYSFEFGISNPHIPRLCFLDPETIIESSVKLVIHITQQLAALTYFHPKHIEEHTP